MTLAQLEEILSRHTHRMHGGTEYYSMDGIYAAFREANPYLAAEECGTFLAKVKDPKTFDVGQYYGKTEILAAMALACDDSRVLDQALSKLQSDQAKRVIPVVTTLLDFWEMLPNDEKDLVRTTPRLACLLDELDAAMEGDGPFTTDEVE